MKIDLALYQLSKQKAPIRQKAYVFPYFKPKSTALK